MLSPTSIADSGRILIVTPQPFYEDRGTPIAIKYVAQALSELGANVDLLAFPVGRDVAIPNVHITRCANPLGLSNVPIGFSWKKLVLDASLWQSFTRLVHTGNYALVHAVEEAAYMASVICPHMGVPFIYDMASAIPVEMARKPLFKSNLVQRMLLQAERRVIRSASRVVCSSGLGDHVRRQVPDANVREWLYPAVMQRADASHTAALRQDLGLGAHQRVILYSGNLAAYQGVDLLIEAFHKLRAIRPELVLVCVGATEHELGQRGLTMHKGMAILDNVLILPRQPREKMPEFLRLADFLVLPRVEADNVPLKLFDYMASGKPIIATRGAAHEPLLNDARAFMSDPNPEAFAAAILQACESPQRAASTAAAAQFYARQNFGWNRFVEFIRFTYSDALNEVQDLRRQVA